MQEHRAQKHRAILNERQAIEIFRVRYTNEVPRIKISALIVAKRYGINEKTVRDIWKQRTWSHATGILDGSTVPMTTKKLGRPIGSKDKHHRKPELPAGSCTTSDSPTSSSTLKRCALPAFHASRPNSERHDGPTEIHQDSAAQSMPFGSPRSESSPEAASPGGEDAASIDAQLHIWAHCGAPWVIDAALPLGAEPDSSAPSPGPAARRPAIP